MPTSDSEWANAFAKQALSDLHVRDELARCGVEKCHRLHFLQMAAEKVCKAYLFASGSRVVRRHDCVRKYLPVIARAFNGGVQISGSELKIVKQFAREIELLAPACEDGGARPDNCEYPWETTGGQVKIPAQYGFPELDDSSRSFSRLIRILRGAARRYES